MLENIKILKAKEVGEILSSPDLTRILLSTYIFLFECKSPQFCAKSLTHYHKQIIENGFKQLTLKTMERKYILKSDVLIYDAITKKHYNSLTITDEVAKEMLKNTPRLAAQFESLPTSKIIEPEKQTIKASVIEIKQIKRQPKKNR